MDRGEGEKLMGFYTTRYVRAKNPEDAESRCIRRLLKTDEYQQRRSGRKKGLAKIVFLEVGEANHQNRLAFGKGNVFFQMSDADEYGDHQVALEIELEAHQNK